MAKDVDIFVMAHDPEWTAYATHIFEMHDLNMAIYYRGKEFQQKLIDDFRGTAIIMQQRHDWIPDSEGYPLVEVIETIGRDYFQSSIAYMLALAIHWEYHSIEILGVDLVDPEYLKQRPNLEWLIGIAEEKGVKVKIPTTSELMAYEPHVGRPGGCKLPVRYPVRYGYHPEPGY